MPETSLKKMTSLLFDGKVPKYKLFYEILDTEERYVKSLNNLQNVIYPCMLKDSKTKKKSIYPSEDKITNIFIKIKPIFDFHSNFLLPQLRQRNIEWNSKPYIYDIFIKIFPFMKLYTDYLCNFSKIYESIDEIVRKFPKIYHSLADFLKTEPTFDIKIELQKPILRITNYKILLDKYEKKMEQGDEEKDKIKEATKSVNDVANHCENAVKQLNQQNRMNEISNQFSQPTRIFIPGRKYIMDEELKMHDEKYYKFTKSYKVFLFSDLIVMTTLGKKKKYEIILEILMKDINSVYELQRENLNILNTFCICASHNPHYLIASSNESKSKWVASIETVRKKYLATEIKTDISMLEVDSCNLKNEEDNLSSNIIFE